MKIMVVFPQDINEGEVKIFYFVSAIMVYLLTYFLTPWSGVLSQSRTSLIVYNPKVHYRLHKCPSHVPILSHIDPVHALTYHFLKIHCNIILPSTPGFSKWSLCLKFPHQNPVRASPLPHPRYMPRPPHSSRLYHPNNIG